MEVMTTAIPRALPTQLWCVADGSCDVWGTHLSGRNSSRSHPPRAWIGGRRAVRSRVGAEHFRAHLTVLGHDGIDNSSARAEARDVLDHLVKDLPDDWTADTITIYRFWSAD